MRVFLNPGHAPNGNPDPGACGNGLRECDVAKSIADLVEQYLVAAGVQVVGNLQCDDLGEICRSANAVGTDIFISIHCNSAANEAALGTEVLCFADGGKAGQLASCIQSQIVDALKTVDRGVKERPNLYVLKHTLMPAILVETAFISNAEDAAKLRDKQDDFARAIAQGVTDFELK